MATLNPLTPFQFGSSAMLIPQRTFSPNDSPVPMRRPRACTASSDAGSVAPSDYTNWSGYGSMYDQAAADEAALDAADAASAHNSGAGSQIMPPLRRAGG
ncbi:unnamed protein product [Tilletia controversa]|nr:unnamed protein product [Tilletia controversa]